MDTETSRRKQTMAKFDLDSLNIDELAALRDAAAAKLLEKVTARQMELEAEMERLSQFGGAKAGKKAAASAPAAKAKKAQDRKVKEISDLDDAPDSVSEAA
jgi:hypothetical protein